MFSGLNIHFLLYAFIMNKDSGNKSVTEENPIFATVSYPKTMVHRKTCQGFDVHGWICKNCDVHTMYAGIQRYSGFCKVVLTKRCTICNVKTKNFNWFCGCLCNLPQCNNTYVHRKSGVVGSEYDDTVDSVTEEEEEQ